LLGLAPQASLRLDSTGSAFVQHPLPCALASCADRYGVPATSKVTLSCPANRLAQVAGLRSVLRAPWPPQRLARLVHIRANAERVRACLVSANTTHTRRDARTDAAISALPGRRRELKRSPG